MANITTLGENQESKSEATLKKEQLWALAGVLLFGFIIFKIGASAAKKGINVATVKA
jgi:hypothetical protein